MAWPGFEQQLSGAVTPLNLECSRKINFDLDFHDSNFCHLIRRKLCAFCHSANFAMLSSLSLAEAYVGSEDLG
jgi:hypothetical protein